MAYNNYLKFKLIQNNKMKTVLSIFLFVFSLALSAQNMNEIPKRYLIKSAKVTYTEQTPEGKGSKVLLFDQYGMRESAHLTLKKNDRLVKDQIVILNGKKAYLVDLLKQTAQDMSDQISGTMSLGQLGGKNMAATGKKMLKAMGGKQVGYENFLGRNCEKWEVRAMGKTTALIWKAIPLRSESKIMGISSLEEAKTIQTGLNFSNTDFMPPAGIKIEHPEGMYGGNQGLNFSDDDKKEMDKLKNLSYPDFKKMMLQGNPDMPEDQIKKMYELKKKLGNIFK
jgi:hypothetical protein